MQALAEQAVLLTVTDNLDLVCAVIEKAAMERATVEIDDILKNAYAIRKRHREQRPGQAFYDMEIFAVTRYPASLPEPLRAKPMGLQPAQMRVYEDFARISRAVPHPQQQQQQQPPPAMTSPGFEADRPIMRQDTLYGYNTMPIGGSGFEPANPAAAAAAAAAAAGQTGTAHQILERFAQYIGELEKLASQTNAPNFAALPPLHEIRMIVRQISMLAMSSFDKVEAARAFAQKAVQLLYKSETQLSREMYVVLLEHLCEVSPNVGTLVTYWLTHVDDERKYNVPVTIALIKAGLINLPEQDQELAVMIENGRPSAIDFAAHLIYACVFKEKLVGHQEFMASLESLSRLRGNVPETVLALMEELREALHNPGSKEPDEEGGFREQCRFLFAEWVRVYQHPSTTDKVQSAFLTQLSQQNIFQAEDMTSLFFRVCVEAAVDRVTKFKHVPTQSPEVAYQLIDAFARMVVGLTQLQTDNQANSSTSAKLSQFSTVLSVIVLVLAQHHEQQQQQFDQRPFLRLFTCLLSELHAAEQQLSTTSLPILTALSNTFHTLQPSYFPGFTFAWLQLISHRLFMPKLLLAENQKVS